MTKHIRLAYNTALKSTSKFRLGAVLVKSGNSISTGFNNMRKTHPLQQKFADRNHYTMGLHAEVACAIGVSAKDLEGADLYVVRLLKNGAVAMAKPCSVCEKFIHDVGIRRVYYSNAEGKMEAL